MDKTTNLTNELTESPATYLRRSGKNLQMVQDFLNALQGFSPIMMLPDVL